MERASCPRDGGRRGAALRAGHLGIAAGVSQRMENRGPEILQSSGSSASAPSPADRRAADNAVRTQRSNAGRCGSLDEPFGNVVDAHEARSRSPGSVPASTSCDSTSDRYSQSTLLVEPDERPQVVEQRGLLERRELAAFTRLAERRADRHRS